MQLDENTTLRMMLKKLLINSEKSESETDALLEYMFAVSNSQEETIQRLSNILHKDLNTVMGTHNIIQFELLKHDFINSQERLRLIEQKLSNFDYSSNKSILKLPMVQAIFTAISFIAATVALLKAFDFLKFPW